MPLTLGGAAVDQWRVRKIGVVGPGIVGMPMAAMLARAAIREGADAPAEVVVVQRNSATSGWKVAAINNGRSVIGGVEPKLDAIVRESVDRGLLRGAHDAAALADADVVLVCAQTDRDGWGPDYGPLMAAVDSVAAAVQRRPAGNVPLIVFESTLAPSSMATVIRERFARSGLHDGRDLLLANSPNRVMPGRLIERIESSDKIIGGLLPAAPELVARLYRHVVTRAALHLTNSLTAEVVKVLENAYRDVRIAFSTEVARRCDTLDVDFFDLRDAVNRRLAREDGASSDPSEVPTGGLLMPTVGVGGHCLPKDGILLWWRGHEAGLDTSRSLVLTSRGINDASPAYAIRRLEAAAGSVSGRVVAVLGAAYRADSEDTRNAPGLEVARQLLRRGCQVRIHDPHVRESDPNLERLGLVQHFATELAPVVADAEAVLVAVAHSAYREDLVNLLEERPHLPVFDGCNLLARDSSSRLQRYVGIGRGRTAPPAGMIEEVASGFRAVERGVANELAQLLAFLNSRYADGSWAGARFDEVRRLAGTCVTGCDIALPGPVTAPADTFGVRSQLVASATGATQ